MDVLKSIGDLYFDGENKVTEGAGSSPREKLVKLYCTHLSECAG